MVLVSKVAAAVRANSRPSTAAPFCSVMEVKARMLYCLAVFVIDVSFVSDAYLLSGTPVQCLRILRKGVGEYYGVARGAFPPTRIGSGDVNTSRIVSVGGEEFGDRRWPINRRRSST
jgi:hypothetical protein